MENNRSALFGESSVGRMPGRTQLSNYASHKLCSLPSTLKWRATIGRRGGESGVVLESLKLPLQLVPCAQSQLSNPGHSAELPREFEKGIRQVDTGPYAPKKSLHALGVDPDFQCLTCHNSLVKGEYLIPLSLTRGLITGPHQSSQWTKSDHETVAR
jgi:hypothetical protein